MRLDEFVPSITAIGGCFSPLYGWRTFGLVRMRRFIDEIQKHSGSPPAQPA
jgi:hypothetical protein